MKIAVIDDGINEGFYDIGRLIFDIEITADLKCIKRRPSAKSWDGHGTQCAAIIKKQYPKALLGSIKILKRRTQRASVAKLVKALQWCASNGIRLVNLSLGTVCSTDFGPIQEAVVDAHAKGVIIVAAENNSRILTYPASLLSVIGVRQDPAGSLEEGRYRYINEAVNGIEVEASANNRLRMIDGGITMCAPCNSYAAPVITGIVAVMIDSKPDITVEEIKYNLCKRMDY